MEDSKIIDFNAFRQRKLAKAQKEADELASKMEKRNRVHTKDYILMVGTALFFDTLQILLSLIPVVGWFLSAGISIFAWLTFYVWSSIKGWGLSDSVKQFIVNWALPLVEIVPLVDVFPAWTARVLLQLAFLKAEDTLYNATEGKADFEKLEKIYKKIA